jgi:hypothetical protein
LEEKHIQLKEVREKYEQLETECKELETSITKNQIELQKKELDLKVRNFCYVHEHDILLYFAF